MTQFYEKFPKKIKLVVSHHDAVIGKEIVGRDCVWVVRALLREKIYDNGIYYLVLAEFVERVIDRLSKKIIALTENQLAVDNSIDALYKANQKNVMISLDHTKRFGALVKDFDKVEELVNRFTTINNPAPTVDLTVKKHSQTFPWGWDADQQHKKTVDFIKVTKHIDVLDRGVFNGVDYEKVEFVFWANCGNCGALLYKAKSISTFFDVFETEIPYCSHCGSMHVYSLVNKDPESYIVEDGGKPETRQKLDFVLKKRNDDGEFVNVLEQTKGSVKLMSKKGEWINVSDLAKALHVSKVTGKDKYGNTMVLLLDDKYKPSDPWLWVPISDLTAPPKEIIPEELK